MKDEIRSFMLLLEQPVKVTDMNQVFTHLNPESVEIWTEMNLLEITTENGTITFEDMMNRLRKTDKELLQSMQIQQVYACDYYAPDSEEVKKLMELLFQKYPGKIGSDTEDFAPFLKVAQL